METDHKPLEWLESHGQSQAVVVIRVVSLCLQYHLPSRKQVDI